MAGNIFINYRRDESGHVAGRLHDSLAPTFGRNKLFMDVDNIPVGRDFEEYLKSQVAACDAMLAVIGPNWLTAKDETGKRRLDNPDDFIVIEIGAALARNISVVPVLVDGARMPKASELPDSLKLLARRQAVQVRYTNFSSDAEALVKRLCEALGYHPIHSTGRRSRVWIAVAAVWGLALTVAIVWHMLNDRKVRAFNHEGLSRFGEGHYEDAVAAFDRAVRQSPFYAAPLYSTSYAEALCNRGRTKLKINDVSGHVDIAKARELNTAICH